MTVPTATPQRALALDALRGLAILFMVFSGRIPFGVLPDWMYHAQVPPPLHKFNPSLPGITWVDLVFPFFLFAMGAAIPLALARRLDSQEPRFKIILSVFSRGLLLAAFAIYSQQIRPWSMSTAPDWYVWSFCLVGFLFLFPMYVRLPASWSSVKQWGTRIFGWGGAVILMAFVKFSDGSGFSLNKSDIIILVLSNVAVTGALLWMFTRNSLPLRIGILGIVAAMLLSSKEDGWTQWLMNASPAPWLFQLRFQKYLFLVIPGTIVGERLLQWMKSSASSNPSVWNPYYGVSLAALMVVLNVVVVVGLKARWVVPTFVAATALCAIAYWLTRHASSEAEKFIKNILHVGIFLLVLGFVFEPFEGGIKKDHSTMSYYFVTGGLAIMMLIALTIVIDIFGKAKWFNLLVTSGQNPLVAYAGVNSLVPPVIGLLGIETLITNLTPTPWLGALRGAFMTYLVALAASVCAKRKIFLKT